MGSVAGKYDIEIALSAYTFVVEIWTSSVNPLRAIAHHCLYVGLRHLVPHICRPHCNALLAVMVTMIKPELVSIKGIVTMPNVLLILEV